MPQEGTDRQREEQHSEAEAAVMQLQANDTRDWDPAAGARKRQRWIPPAVSNDGASPADTLTLDL